MNGRLVLYLISFVELIIFEHLTILHYGFTKMFNPLIRLVLPILHPRSHLLFHHIFVKLPSRNRGAFWQNLINGLFFLFLSLISPSVMSMQELYVSRTEDAPKIDGNPDDVCWKKSPVLGIPLTAEKDRIISVQACQDFDNLYILASYPANTESRKHTCWHWDSINQIYRLGEEKEDCLTVIWTQKEYAADKADIWIWRSARTDPAGFADDYFSTQTLLTQPPCCYLNSFPLNLFPDNGTNSWYSRYFSKFTGEEIPRFYHRPPAGSSAHVHARGNWNDGFWIIEFSRKLSTGHKDDLDFAGIEKLYLMFLLGAPESTPVKNMPTHPVRIEFPLAKPAVKNSSSVNVRDAQ